MSKNVPSYGACQEIGVTRHQCNPFGNRGPDFDSPLNVVNAASDALKNGYTHYAISAGMEEFREASSKMTKRSRGFLPTINQILVTPGG
jgi:aspartate/methionine/tyrosine aminotransferase